MIKIKPDHLKTAPKTIPSPGTPGKALFYAVVCSCVHLPAEILSYMKAGTKAWFIFNLQFASCHDKLYTPNNCWWDEWLNVIECINKCSRSQNILQKGQKITNK